jgi:hypothetical protein
VSGRNTTLVTVVSGRVMVVYDSHVGSSCVGAAIFSVD